jgi:hypothetical protein
MLGLGERVRQRGRSAPAAPVVVFGGIGNSPLYGLKTMLDITCEYPPTQAARRLLQCRMHGLRCLT